MKTRSIQQQSVQLTPLSTHWAPRKKIKKGYNLFRTRCLCSVLEFRKFQALGFFAQTVPTILGRRVLQPALVQPCHCGSDDGERRPDFNGKSHCRRTLALIECWNSQGRPYCVYGFDIQEFYILPPPTHTHCIYVFCIYFGTKSGFCAPFNINGLVFVTDMKSVYCAVRSGSSNKAV